MSEMVNRVAEAICQAVFGPFDPAELDRPSSISSQSVLAARAAIEAMREPGEDYFAAMVKTLGCRNDEAHRDATRRVHQMWIDEALK